MTSLTIQSAPPKVCFQISTHAHFRVLERTQLSGGQVIDRLNLRACAWLPRRSRFDTYYALLYCALSEIFVVAVIAPDNPVLKTILTREQWETTYGNMASIHLALAQLAAAQTMDNSSASLAIDAKTLRAEPTKVKRIRPTTGLDLYVWAAMRVPKQPYRQEVLGKIPDCEVAALNLGPVCNSNSPVLRNQLLRSDVAQGVCQRIFFKDWLEQKLAEMGDLLPEVTAFYISYGKFARPPNWSLRECISPLVRAIWLEEARAA